MMMTVKAVPYTSPMAAMAALLLSLTILQLAVHGHAQSPPSGSVKIEGFSYNGDGCPFGTAEGSVSDDGQALTVMFSKYTATTDQGQAGMRKSCTVTAKLNYPAGFIFSLGTVTMRGYAKLDDGVVGTIQTSYYISGLPGTAKASRDIKGAFNDNFEHTDKFLAVVYSQCNKVRDLNLKSEVRVNPGKFKPARSGIFTVDSQDLKLTQIYALLWKPC